MQLANADFSSSPATAAAGLKLRHTYSDEPISLATAAVTATGSNSNLPAGKYSPKLNEVFAVSRTATANSAAADSGQTPTTATGNTGVLAVTSSLDHSTADENLSSSHQAANALTYPSSQSPYHLDIGRFVRGQFGCCCNYPKLAI